jgi:hypothetical protein
MHTEVLQFSVPAPLSPALRLFRSLDGNADGKVTNYEVKTSGVFLPKTPVQESAKSAAGDGTSSQDNLSNSASRFQYFLQMMTQAADKVTPEAKSAAAPKPAETNPYLKNAALPEDHPGADTTV